MRWRSRCSVTKIGITLRDVRICYENEDIIAGLNLELGAGHFTALLGPSGVGKTTLLRAIAGLQKLDGGRISASDDEPLDGRIAYMGQSDLLLPWAGALQNIALGAKLRGEPPDLLRAAKSLADMGLRGRERARPAQLSGGERQRIALARTLYEARPIVLMDEPFSALDAITRVQMQNLAARALQGCTVLFITHDPLEACRLAHRIYVLSGKPATLSTPTMFDTPIPRPLDDQTILKVQASLLRSLAGTV